MVDWRTFYHKSFMSKFGGEATLNCKNSLFLLDMMKKSIHPEVVKKYAEIDILSLFEEIFKETKIITDRIYKLQRKHCQHTENPSQQLLSMIFENGFSFSMAERLFEIKRAFKKKSGSDRSISYSRLLEILNA